MNNYEYFMNMIQYDYSLNRYSRWDAEYDTITLHYDKKYNITSGKFLAYLAWLNVLRNSD